MGDGAARRGGGSRAQAAVRPGFKADSAADEGLPDLVDKLLLDSALSSLSMARKAGRVVTGFGKVTQAVSRGPLVAVIHATEAADDGRRKVAQAIRRRIAAESADDDYDDDDLDEDEVDTDISSKGAADDGDPSPPVAAPHVVSGLFSGAELDLALGGLNVIHAALLAGGVSTSFLRNAAALARYRGGAPDTDWKADLGRGDRNG